MRIMPQPNALEREASFAQARGAQDTEQQVFEAMQLNGHMIGLLKEYMHDLVQQAIQEAQAQHSFGFAAAPYRPDHAISDLLAILDDRIESEGLQVGLPEAFLHEMWVLCNEALAQVQEEVWLESSAAGDAHSKARTRELTYQALLDYMEQNSGGV
jgi:hypothetical protein